MSEYCRSCVMQMFGDEKLADRNSFAGRAAPGERVLALCDGCGEHRFDHTGARACHARSWFEDSAAVAYFYACEECRTLVRC